MNHVSDLKLAIAAYDAGIFPSLVITNIAPEGIKHTENELKAFKEYTGSCNLIIALTPRFFTPSVIQLILDYKVSHLEFFEKLQDKDIPMLNFLRKNNIRIIEKYLTSKDVIDSDIIPYIDIIDLKSSDGASRIVDTDENLMQRYQTVRKKYPMMPLILTGGISTPEQIKELIDAGATAVSLGTVFALSEESSIHHEKKKYLINSSYLDITKVKAGGEDQNAIVFSTTPDTDNNNSVGLIVGRTTADRGLLFAGKGIDNIHSIKSVSTIVKELTN
jgi:hypothetical protein